MTHDPHLVFIRLMPQCVTVRPTIGSQWLISGGMGQVSGGPTCHPSWRQQTVSSWPSGFRYSEDLIGTNAMGTAITQQGPSAVAGAEHFADALTPMECAATPVTDGAGQMTGVIDLTCAAENFRPMLLAGVSAAAAGGGGMAFSVVVSWR